MMGDISCWLALLVVFAIVFPTAGFMTFDYVVKE
jgi:hypothetical protein